MLDENGNPVPSSEPPAIIEEGKNDERVKKYYIGENKLRVRRDNMEIVSTYMNGEVKDWDAFEQVLLDIYEN